MNTFQLEILSPEKPFYSGPCVSIVIPTTDGMMGIQANHSPLTAALPQGEIAFTLPDGERRVCAVDRGMVSVSGNRVRVLSESAVSPDEIDEEAERRALEAAEIELRDKQSQEDFLLSQLSLRRSISRLKVKRSSVSKNL